MYILSGDISPSVDYKLVVETKERNQSNFI